MQINNPKIYQWSQYGFEGEVRLVADSSNPAHDYFKVHGCEGCGTVHVLATNSKQAAALGRLWFRGKLTPRHYVWHGKTIAVVQPRTYTQPSVYAQQCTA